MAIPTLQSRVICGLRTEITNNVHYVSDNEYLFPVGHVLVINNISQHRQRLLRLPDKYKINNLCLAPNKRYVAITEVSEKPMIMVYDLQTMKRKKVLGIPYETQDVTKFNCLDFTFDNKYLAAVTGEPDQTMLFYNWDKGKVESNLKVGHPYNHLATVNMITCNPGESGIVAMGGLGNFKFLTLSDNVWRPYGFSKADNLLISSMAWLTTDRLLAGTLDGRILYLENGDLKNIYKMSETISMSLKIREEYVLQTTSTKVNIEEAEKTHWNNDVRGLLAFNKGFAFGYGSGYVIFFEKVDVNKYSKRNIYAVPRQPIRDENLDMYKIHSIEVNANEDRLIVSTIGWPLLFSIVLWGTDLHVDPNPQEMEILGEMTHYGPISGISICSWKPMFMTSGRMDRTIRLWDYESGHMMLMKHYSDDIYSIALHPIGLFCLIGFTDKLRFMSIIIDDFVQMQEFPIRLCHTVVFSHGAHLFSAVDGNVVHVYTTMDFNNRFTLRGHTGRVNCLAWSHDDLRLLTMGSEGAIYEWDMTNGERLSEMIFKNLALRGIMYSAELPYSYCIAEDSIIRRIKDGQVVHEFNVINEKTNLMALANDDTSLFVTGNDGIILSFKCPLQDPVNFTDIHIHNTDITTIAMTHCGEYLITGAVDGSLCIWKVQQPDLKITHVAKEMIVKEVLVYRNDVEDKVQVIRDLTLRLKELETEHAYKTRLIEAQHNDKIRELHEGYTEAINELREKIEKLQEERKTEMNNINVEIRKMKKVHEEAIRQKEINYHEKLIEEYEKYKSFEDRTNAMRASYEEQLKQLHETSENKLTETVKSYEEKVNELNLRLKLLEEEMIQQEKLHEHLTAQIEDDVDGEIIQLRTNYEALLHERMETNLKLKGEAGVMKNKYLACQKDVDDLRRQNNILQNQYDKLRRNFNDLDNDVTNLKKEINERDTTIQDKERQLYELRNNNKELEKFKFVLNYKISELKSQIEPRDIEIKNLKSRVNDMEEELVELNRVNEKLKLQLSDLKDKWATARREIKKEHAHERQCKKLLKRIRMDLFDASRLIQEPNALKVAVTKLYQQYSASEEFLLNREEDFEAQCEFLKQRDHLEKTIQSLKKQVLQEPPSVDKNMSKVLEENMTLIQEINMTREALKDTRKHILDLETLLGLRAKTLKAAEAKNKVEKACEGRDKLQNEFNIQISECENVIMALKEDIKRILNTIATEKRTKGRASI